VDSCDNCSRLESRIEHLEDQVEDLERALEAISQYCQGVTQKARPTLARQSGVPRGAWSRLKGRVDVAGTILGYLQ
jgi:prefoldin subunit 5